jgi:hypothetical protein
MSRNGIITIIIIFCIGLILYTTWKEPHTDWRSKYSLESYEPFDLAVSQELIDDYFEITYLRDSLQKSLNKTNTKGSYMYIGHMAHDSSSLELIKAYCEKGNDAHLFLDLNTNNYFYTEFYDTYRNFSTESLTVKLDNSDNLPEQRLNFTYPKGAFQFKYYYVDPEFYQFFDSKGLIEDDNYENDNGDTHYFSIPMGDGMLYVHLCPLVFSNYSLTEQQNLDYFEAVLNNFKSDQILLDVFNSEARSLRSFANAQNNANRAINNNGPLSYIFANPALKYSWYLFLTGIILFFLFQAKRQQRPIPVLGRKKNRSLEFIEQSAYIFYKSKDHNEISKIQIAMFNNYIKEEYGLNFNAFKKEKMDDTAKRINLPVEQIEKVAAVILYIERLMNVQEKDLIKLNRQLENFYHLSENK